MSTLQESIDEPDVWLTDLVPWVVRAIISTLKLGCDCVQDTNFDICIRVLFSVF
jgi:hypothetical protein